MTLALFAVTLALVPSPLSAVGPPTNSPAFLKLASRTNLPAALRFNRTNSPGVLPPARTNAAAAGKPNLARTNAVATLQHSATNAPSRAADIFQRVQSNRAFYPVVAGLAVGLVVLLVARSFRRNRVKAGGPGGALVPAKPGSRLPATRAPSTTAHACNVLEVGPQARQVWQFDARGSYSLNREQTCLEGEPLPGKIVAKDWRSLFQPKLNVAWLPPEQVFLRVIQLPRSDFDETLAMVELQLEKLSPIPVAQIAWSLQILPHSEGNSQTVVVLIVARSVVEEFLGKLESQGYLADRLELPLLDQLQADAITEDGAWIYPESAVGKNTALVAWWYGGVLRNLDLLTMPATNRPAALKEQLMQMAWAGELEGWLSSPPEWHLVADVKAAEWEPALREGLEQRIEVINPLPARQLAALTARRAAQAEPRSNLLPAEFVTRYRQQFVDRLWMRGLLAGGGIYLLYVIFQMSRLAYAGYLAHDAEAQVAQYAPSYTNAIQLRDRYKVLKDREELKFAALDCWSTTARLLPENVVVDSFSLTDGRRLNLTGSAPADQTQKLLEFDRDIRRAPINGQPLFDANKGDSITWIVQGPNANWRMALELNRSEVQ
jgi:hypothetical protein